MLSPDGMSQLRRVATILLPGDGRSPAAESLPDLDDLLASAVRAVGVEGAALRDALTALPEDLDWTVLRSFAESHPAEFDIISVVASGAYFMSPDVLTSIGYPQGPRRAPRPDQVVDELETGVLDVVMARDSMVREVPR